MFFVYLLQSDKDGSFYIGQTQDLAIRLQRHNNGLVPSTRAKTPWQLMGSEIYASREEARWREFKIKKSFSAKKAFIAKFLSP